MLTVALSCDGAPEEGDVMAHVHALHWKAVGRNSGDATPRLVEQVEADEEERVGMDEVDESE